MEGDENNSTLNNAAGSSYDNINLSDNTKDNSVAVNINGGFENVCIDSDCNDTEPVHPSGSYVNPAFSYESRQQLPVLSNLDEHFRHRYPVEIIESSDEETDNSFEGREPKTLQITVRHSCSCHHNIDEDELHSSNSVNKNIVQCKGMSSQDYLNGAASSEFSVGNINQCNIFA